MGCFWHAEPLFCDIKGVKHTEVGYHNCATETPSCSDVFKVGVTHREVVKVVFDSLKTDIEELFKVFWESHTVDDRSDYPVPDLYKSGIFVTSNAEKILSENSMLKYKKIREDAGNYFPISTEINFIKKYKKAQESHQKYNLKNKNTRCSKKCSINYN